MSTIDLFQLLRRIPDTTDDEAKAAVDSIAHVEDAATKADLHHLEIKLTRLIFGSAAVVIAAVSAIVKLI